MHAITAPSLPLTGGTADSAQKAQPVCSAGVHDKIKADLRRWKSLPFACWDTLRGVRDVILEGRTCICNSTLYRPVRVKVTEYVPDDDGPQPAAPRLALVPQSLDCDLVGKFQ